MAGWDEKGGCTLRAAGGTRIERNRRRREKNLFAAAMS